MEFSLPNSMRELAEDGYSSIIVIATVTLIRTEIIFKATHILNVLGERKVGKSGS